MSLPLKISLKIFKKRAAYKSRKAIGMNWKDFKQKEKVWSSNENGQ